MTRIRRIHADLPYYGFIRDNPRYPRHPRSIIRELQNPG